MTFRQRESSESSESSDPSWKSDEGYSVSSSDQESPPKRKRIRTANESTAESTAEETDNESLSPVPEDLKADSPSAPQKFLIGDIPDRVKKTLRKWYGSDCEKSRRVINDFTLGSNGVNWIYQKRGREIAQYLDHDNNTMEVQFYFLRDILPQLVGVGKRAVLVAQNEYHGPWIIAFKNTIKGGMRQKIWRGVKGFDKRRFAKKIWIPLSQLRRHAKSAVWATNTTPELSVDSRFKVPDTDQVQIVPSRETLACYKPSIVETEIMKKLVLKLKNYIPRHAQECKNFIREFTTRNGRFPRMEAGVPAIFKTIEDGASARAFALSSAHIGFLSARTNRQRFLNIVIDAQQNGYIVKFDGNGRRGAVTRYCKWIAGEGFDPNPFVKKISAPQQMGISGQIPRRVSAPSEGVSSALAAGSPEMIPETNRNDDDRTTEVGSTQLDQRLTTVNTSQSNETVQASSSSVGVTEPSQEQLIFGTVARESVAASSRESLQGNSLQTFPTGGPKAKFRFDRSSVVGIAHAFTDVDVEKCDTLDGFGMELAKSGVCSIKEARSGKFRLCITIGDFNDQTFLMNGADADEYSRLMDKIREIQGDRTNAEKIIVKVEAWSRLVF